MYGDRWYTASCRYVKGHTKLNALAGPSARLIRRQEEDVPTLHIVAAFLLYDGRNSKDDELFAMMHSEGTFPRLIELIQMETMQEDIRLHQVLLELLYESSRIQRLTSEDFCTLDL